MADGRRSNDEFFVQLAKLIEHTQSSGHGSIFMTQKRLVQKSEGADIGLNDLKQTEPLPVLVRVSDGDTQSAKRVKNRQHVKFSTVVEPKDLEGFFAKYADTCKAGMQSLKKRDRSKRKKDKSKKKKAAAEPKT